MDGHFGNYPNAWMVLQTGLQFVSKLRSDAALYEPFAGNYCGRGARPKYGDTVDVRKMKKKYLKSDKRNLAFARKYLKQSGSTKDLPSRSIWW